MISGFTAFSTVFQNFSTDCRFVCMSKVGWCGLDGGGGGVGGWRLEVVGKQWMTRC